ncbi:unnamed protein product, partial [Adineta ricciae]
NNSLLQTRGRLHSIAEMVTDWAPRSACLYSSPRLSGPYAGTRCGPPRASVSGTVPAPSGVL